MGLQLFPLNFLRASLQIINGHPVILIEVQLQTGTYQNGNHNISYIYPDDYHKMGRTQLPRESVYITLGL